MARDRITPCLYYIGGNECEKGRCADYSRYCQRCDKYKARAKKKYINRKKEELKKIEMKDGIEILKGGKYNVYIN